MRFLIALILLGSTTLNAELIPAARLYPGWTNAGVGGTSATLPNRTTIHTTLTPTGDTTDRTAAINSAISACPSNSVVILEGPGDFYCNSTITFGTTSGKTLRGTNGAKIISSASSRAILMGTGGTDWPYPTDGPALSADAAQFATVLTFSDASSFTVGDRVRIYQNNDTNLPVVHVSGNTKLRHFQTVITAKDSTTITLENPVPFALTTALSAGVKVISGGFAVMCSVEDLEIDCSPGNMQSGFHIWNAYKCWLRDVKITMPVNQNIYLISAINCEFRRVHCDGVENTGSNGAGILMERSSLNWIEDCIIENSFPNVEMFGQNSANVISYCALEDSAAGDESDTFGGSLNINHHPHNSHNLLEGNISPQVQDDGYFGSTSQTTLLRNRITGSNSRSNPLSGNPSVNFERFAREHNVVGNLLGMLNSYWTGGTTNVYSYETSGQVGPAAYKLGYPNIGNSTFTGTAELSTGDPWADWGGTPGQTGFQERDLDVENTVIRKANFNAFDNAVPGSEATGDTVPISYIRIAKPSWFGDRQWPPYNYESVGTLMTDLEASYEAIPAGYRLVNGSEVPEEGGGGESGASDVNVTELRVGTIQVAP